VQHFREGFCRGPEVKTLPRSVVVSGYQSDEALARKRGEVGFSRQEAAHSANGILNPALLPRCVAIAEEGSDFEPVKLVMASKLGPVVERDGPAQPFWQRGEQADQVARDRLGSLGARPGGEQDARLALVHGEHGLTVFGKQHEIGLPVTGHLAAGRTRRPF